MPHSGTWMAVGRAMSPQGFANQKLVQDAFFYRRRQRRSDAKAVMADVAGRIPGIPGKVHLFLPSFQFHPRKTTHTQLLLIAFFLFTLV